MSIYDEIEKWYLKNNFIVRINIYVNRVFLILGFLSIALNLLFEVEWGSLLILNFIVISFSLLLFLVFDYINNYSILKCRMTFRKSIKLYLNKIFNDNCNIDDLIEILEKNNVKYKQDVLMIKQHFTDKKVRLMRSFSIYEFITLFITTVSFFLNCYDKLKELVNENIILILLFMILLVMSVTFFKCVFNLFNYHNKQFYSDIEKYLNYVYIEFDNRLNNMQFSIFLYFYNFL